MTFEDQILEIVEGRAPHYHREHYIALLIELHEKYRILRNMVDLRDPE